MSDIRSPANVDTKKFVYKKWWFWVIIIIGVIYINSGDKDSKSNFNSSRINLSEFNQLRYGMSYSEAIDIIGGFGTVISEGGTGSFRTIIYEFKGQGSIGANANLVFQDGKLINKAQYGLK